MNAAQASAASEYRYLESEGKTIDGVDDYEAGAGVISAMAAVGMGALDQSAVRGLLTGILALGNVDFEPSEPGGSQV